MKNLVKIGLIGVIMVLLVLLSGCWSQTATLTKTVTRKCIELDSKTDSSIVTETFTVSRSKWASGDGESLGILGINLAKAKYTDENNAIEMTAAQNTRVRRNTYRREYITGSTKAQQKQSDFDQKYQDLKKQCDEALERVRQRNAKRDKN